MGKENNENFLEEYTLLDELGQGGYATVYKVRHNQLGYIRAIRVLNAVIAHGKEDSTYQKFLDECRLLLRLGNGNHPNIVHIYQPLLLAQRAIVEMDYVDGEDLYHHLKRNNSFVPAEDVMRLLTDIGSALAYCHEDIYKFCMDKDEDNLRDDPADGSKLLIDAATRRRLVEKYRVIHNDIHSGNIIRRENGSYVLLDFGLAIEGAEVVRSSRRKNGAPEFKSPEKWDNEGVLTTQSDIYSFGVVLYEFLAGRVPFPFDKQNTDSTEAEYLLGRAHRYQQPEPIFGLRKAAFEAAHPGEEYRQDYPQWIEDVIMKCLAKDPAKRYRNGRELYDCIAKHTGAEEAWEIKSREYEEQIAKLRGSITSCQESFEKEQAKLQREVEVKSLELERAREKLSQAKAEGSSAGRKWKIAAIALVAVLIPTVWMLWHNMNNLEAVHPLQQVEPDGSSAGDGSAERISKLEQEAKAQKDSINTLNKKLKAYYESSNSSDQLQTLKEEHKKEIDDKNAKISSLEEKIKQNERTISQKNNEIEQNKKTISQKDNIIKQKNNEIEQYQKTIKQKDADISSLKKNNNNSTKDNEIKKLEAERDKLREKLKDLNESLDDYLNQ